MSLTTRQHRGWDVVRLANDEIVVDVVPGKGGDILTVAPVGGENLLWSSPWGLRPRNGPVAAGSSHAVAMDYYPGGWQTVFPNGGDPCVEHDVEWPFHGEVWTASLDWSADGDDAVAMSTRLVRSPFELTKRVHVAGCTVTVTETVRNVGGHGVDVMWTSHPAFGPPLVDGDCRIDTNAQRFIVDAERDTRSRDLDLGAEGSWPRVRGRDGEDVDLRRVPAPGAGVDRMAYLTDFAGEPWVTLTNEAAGVAVRLEWDASVQPHAWYWLEANATPGFPWYRAAYVLAIEPASSFPARGLATVRRTTGTQRRIAAGATATSSVSLSVSNLR